MAQGSEHIDYEETPDLTEVHAAIQRENSDPSADVTPAPVWVVILCGVAICWAGAYVGMFHGGFSSDVYNEFETSPAVLFPQPERATAKAGPAVAEDMVAIGKGVYQGNCQSCHQPNGMGQAGAIPPLAASEWVVGSEKRLAMILLKGAMGALKVKEATYNGVMPPWEAALSDKKIAAVMTYVRQEWGNKATPVTAAQITAARKEFAAHKASFTEAELTQVPADAVLEGGAPAAGAPPATAVTSAAPPTSGSPAPAAPGTAASPTASAPAGLDVAKLMEEGKKNYMVICVACHQPSGAGLPGAFPPLIKSEYVTGSPERLAAIILKGVMGPITVDGKPFNSMMPPQEAALTDQKVASVMTYVRNSFENKAAPVGPDVVAAVRKKMSGHPTPLTEAELKAWDSTAAPEGAANAAPSSGVPTAQEANPEKGPAKPADSNPAGPAASSPKPVSPEPADPAKSNPVQ